MKAAKYLYTNCFHVFECLKNLIYFTLNISSELGGFYSLKNIQSINTWNISYYHNIHHSSIVCIWLKNDEKYSIVALSTKALSEVRIYSSK